MLITGVAVVVVNLKPLIKLDGYYALAELIGFADIKEKSTRFLSSIVRWHLFGLPVEVEYVPRRRRVWYVVYAVLSGLYSYSLLFVVVRFSRNVFLNYSPSWAFVPALAFGYFVFRSRIRTLMRFARTVYLDKRDRVRALFTTTRIAIAVTVVLVVLFAPIWRETVTVKFVLEPAQRAFVHAEVPGNVVAVLVQEGQSVKSGEPLLQMVDIRMESQRAEAQHRLAMTGLDQVQAQLHNTSLAPALIEHENAKAQAALSENEGERLTPRAPIDGMVMTRGVRDLAGSYLDAGSTIAEIADTREMRVRMFILEYAVSEVPPNAEARLLLDGRFHSKSCRIQEIKPTPSELAVGLAGEQQLKGISQLRYYVADALIPNDGTLREGMSGDAKILVRHRSLAGFLSKEAGTLQETEGRAAALPSVSGSSPVSLG
jgi:putative peptide zinc metalloprotease protein